MDEAGKVPSRAWQACNEANADRVGNNRKYNRDRPRLPLECSGLWSSVREDYVGLQVEQLFRGHPHPVYVAGGPTNVHAQVAAIGPTQLRKSLREPGEVGLCLRIVFIERHQNADPPHAAGLLRPRRERPCRYAAKPGDELPPSHLSSLQAHL
jgi:hypothetical protein